MLLSVHPLVFGWPVMILKKYWKKRNPKAEMIMNHRYCNGILIDYEACREKAWFY
jgi:hypothetical protein